MTDHATLKCCSLRLFVPTQNNCFEWSHSNHKRERCNTFNHSWHRARREIFLSAWSATRQRLLICREKRRHGERTSVPGQFWRDRLVSHGETTCHSPPSFNVWSRVKMAASHSGSRESQSDQFSGSRDTSASLHLCTFVRSMWTGQREWRAAPRLIPSMGWDAGEGEMKLPLHHGWIPARQTQTETDIYRHLHRPRSSFCPLTLSIF